jgi:hypothetical protein
MVFKKANAFTKFYGENKTTMLIPKRTAYYHGLQAKTRVNAVIKVFSIPPK